MEASAGRHEDINATDESRRAAYEAFASGDVRYDGNLFVGVSSTGIYCRPVCTAKMPRFENCTFYRSAAEAEAAGFRPCKRCRPEIAPGMSPSDASKNLARRAALLLRENCSSGCSIESLATKLGYTDRHLRRAFVDEFGVTPVQYLQSCRLLLAKTLLTDSDLMVSQVAYASGFGSVRRLNHLFKEHYRMTPTDLRKNRRSKRGAAGTVRAYLGYRPPYRFGELLDFFAMRALEGVELVDNTTYTRTVRLLGPNNTMVCGWLRVADAPERNALAVTLSDDLIPVLPQVLARIRRQFDVDGNPDAVARGLRSMTDDVPGGFRAGTRLPGCFDPFETACRAVLGQQVTVKAANRIASRIVSHYGAKLACNIEGLAYAWPTAEEMQLIGDVESALGTLGVIKTRSHTIAHIARLVAAGELDLGTGGVFEDQQAALLSIKGIGPWTAGYIAMRVLGHPDVFLETDAGVAHAMPYTSPAQRLERAQQWAPWRSYAVIGLWNSLKSE